MPSFLDYLTMIVVGAFWGCTNPLVRHGAVESTKIKTRQQQKQDSLSPPIVQRYVPESLKKFRHVGVWLPYALNQVGSVLFYFTLGNSEISLAVPICNGLALVFSVITCFLLGEEVMDAFRTVIGSSLIVVGVTICVLSADSD